MEITNLKYETDQNTLKNKKVKKIKQDQTYATFVSSHQQGETITEYVENGMAVGKRIEKTDKEIVDQIINGINDKYKQMVMMKEPNKTQCMTLFVWQN